MKSKNMSKILMDNILYICLLLMIVIIAIISPSFISVRVLSDVLTQSAPKMLLAVGMLVVIIAGGMDMTVGRLAGLGLQLIIYGGNLLFMKKAPNNSQPLAGFKESFTKFGTGSVAGVNYLIIVAFVVMIAVYIILNMTTLGKNIYATGGNREAAKVAGINVFKIDMFVYILSGALAALAGCMLAARTGSANATYAEGYEMDAIASCIIGGASFTGGIGNVPGAFLGVIIFSVISYGLTFVGLSSYWQNIAKGLIIIVAVALDMRKYGSDK